MWVGWVCGAELVTLSDQADGGVREVGDTVGDVTGGDEALGGCEEDFAEPGLPRADRGRQLQLRERLLHSPGIRVPVRLPQVKERDAVGLGGGTSVSPS